MSQVHTPAFTPTGKTTLSRFRPAVCALIALFVLAAPLAVCLPLNSDTALFDVQASEVLKGGLLYRDIVEPNLPGAVWLHLLIRSIVGWSSEAMQAVDLCLFAVTVWIMSRFLDRQRVLFGLLASLFYVSCNEWVHCQRDTWMLLPATAAVYLCLRRTLRPSWKLAVLEGVLWGIAFWIKPHVVVPALAVSSAGLFLAPCRRSAARQLLGVLGGGVVAGLPGITWLVMSGAWPYFLEMMLEWNPEYLAAGKARQSLLRWQLMLARFFPWYFVHLATLPAVALWRKRTIDAGRLNPKPILITAFYGGWLIQSVGLQHAMDYIHAPAMVLGILLLFRIAQSWPANTRGEPRTAGLNPVFPIVCTICLLVVTTNPFFQLSRLSLWRQCMTDGSTAEVRSHLAHGNFPDWQHLDRVRIWLQSQNIKDGDLTCFNVHSVHLFRELDVQPATRYWAVGILQDLFPGRAQSITSRIRDSQTRFFVTEERESRYGREQIPVGFPWNHPVAFQSGTYRIHELKPKSDSQVAGRAIQHDGRLQQ